MKDTFLCIASGPSLTKEQVEYCYGFREKITTIVVNDNYILAPWADHLYAADVTWWRHHLAKVNESFSGKKWIPNEEKFAKENGLTLINCKYMEGLGKNGILHCGHNSGYQAINLAFQLGAEKIILIGYDFKVENPKMNHWFGQHGRGLRNETKYEKWLKHFDKLKIDLDREKVDVVNCSLDTNLNHFRKSKLEEELI